MKKTLVLASLLAAFGAASAQSSVTLYGVADAYIGQSKTTNSVLPLAGTPVAGAGALTIANNGVSQTVINSGGQFGSRWGIRGSEQLGNGMKAIFTMEQGVALDSGAGGEGAATVFSRQVFAGFEGGFGKVTLGRQYTSYDSARGGRDTHGHSAFSATGAAWQSTGRDYLYRLNNSIRFDSANYSGFTVSAIHGLGENKTATTSAGAVTAFSLGYAAGPLALVAAMQTEKNGGVTGSGGNSGFFNNAGTTKETHTLISGSYNFGVAKLNVGYNTSKDNGVGKGEKEMHVGVNIPFGATSVDLAYATSKEANYYKANSVGLHVNYALSPRTVAYVGANKLTANSDPAGVSTKKSLMAVGFRHSF